MLQWPSTNNIRWGAGNWADQVPATSPWGLWIDRHSLYLTITILEDVLKGKHFLGKSGLTQTWHMILPSLRNRSTVALGTRRNMCRYCNALRWKEEWCDMCCSTLQISARASLQPAKVQPRTEKFIGAKIYFKYSKTLINEHNSFQKCV